MKHLSEFSGRLLNAFLSLVDTGQFKLAAERCNVSQSAFSQMISRLEEQLGTRLFDRDTRSVSLTPEGKLLVPIARGIEADIEAMFSELRDHAEHRKGKVTIAALPSSARTGCRGSWLNSGTAIPASSCNCTMPSPNPTWNSCAGDRWTA